MARVSPSRIEAFDRCALKAFLDSHGARRTTRPSRARVRRCTRSPSWPTRRPSSELETHDGRALGRARLRGAVVRPGRAKRASTMLERLSTWLNSSRRELTLVARELDFRVSVDDVELAGQVDRLEIDPTAARSSWTSRRARPPSAGGVWPSTCSCGVPGGRRSGRVRRHVPSRNPAAPAWSNSAPPARTSNASNPRRAGTGPVRIRRVIATVAALQRGHRFDATVNVCARTAPPSGSVPPTRADR